MIFDLLPRSVDRSKITLAKPAILYRQAAQLEITDRRWVCAGRELLDALYQRGLPAPLAQFIGAGAVILVERAGLLGHYAFQRVRRDDVNLDRISTPAAWLGSLGPSHLRHDDHPGRQRRSQSIDTPKLSSYTGRQSKRPLPDR